MNSFLSILFFSGLVTVAGIALKTNPRWPAKLMLAGSITSLVFTVLMILLIEEMNYGLILIFLILMAINLIGIILFITGLLAYTIKTYTASKANKQFEYLNYQLKDQIAIQEKQLNK